MTVNWKISQQAIEYPEAVAAMEQRVADIRSGEAEEQVWLLEHRSLFTAGTRSQARVLCNAHISGFLTRRGGEHTYHGGGQRGASIRDTGGAGLTRPDESSRVERRHRIA